MSIWYSVGDLTIQNRDNYSGELIGGDPSHIHVARTSSHNNLRFSIDQTDVQITALELEDLIIKLTDIRERIPR